MCTYFDKLELIFFFKYRKITLTFCSTLFQSLGLWTWACKLVGTVEQTGEYNFSLKGKKTKLNSSFPNQVHNSPFKCIFFSCSETINTKTSKVDKSCTSPEFSLLIRTAVQSKWGHSIHFRPSPFAMSKAERERERGGERGKREREGGACAHQSFSCAPSTVRRE